jgi:ribosomal protein L29
MLHEYFMSTNLNSKLREIGITQLFQKLKERRKSFLKFKQQNFASTYEQPTFIHIHIIDFFPNNSKLFNTMILLL